MLFDVPQSTSTQPSLRLITQAHESGLSRCYKIFALQTPATKNNVKHLVTYIQLQRTGNKWESLEENASKVHDLKIR